MIFKGAKDLVHGSGSFFALHEADKLLILSINGLPSEHRAMSILCIIVYDPTNLTLISFEKENQIYLQHYPLILFFKLVFCS